MGAASSAQNHKGTAAHIQDALRWGEAAERSAHSRIT
jgi:hypothetical protein